MVQVFTREAMQQIADVVRRVLGEPGVGGIGEPSGRQGHAGLLIFVVKVGGSDIAAASGTTPGSGTVTVYKITSGALAVHNDANSAAVTKTAYNLSAAAIPANSYALAIQDQVGGNLWIIPTATTTDSNTLLAATLNGTLTYGGTTTATAGSTTVTVYDHLLSSGQSIASGKKVTVSYSLQDDKWYVTGAQCP